MTNQDLQQISNLLDEKLDQKLKENNKNLVTKDYLDKKFESFRLETCEFISKNVLEGIEEAFQRHLDPVRLQINEIETKLREIEIELQEVKERLKKLVETESEDIEANAKDVSFVKKVCQKLEQEIKDIKEQLKLLQIKQVTA